MPQGPTQDPQSPQTNTTHTAPLSPCASNLLRKANGQSFVMTYSKPSYLYHLPKRIKNPSGKQSAAGLPRGPLLVGGPSHFVPSPLTPALPSTKTPSRKSPPNSTQLPRMSPCDPSSLPSANKLPKSQQPSSLTVSPLPKSTSASAPSKKLPTLATPEGETLTSPLF